MGIISADDLARIPVEPPRRPDLLPGLQLSRSVSKPGLALPLALFAFMALMPLLILSQDRDAQLALRDAHGMPAAARCLGETPGPGARQDLAMADQRECARIHG